MAIGPQSVTRFFSADKTVPSRTMNRMGAQVARTVLARVMHNLRAPRVSVDPSVRDHVATLERDGLLVIPNFVSDSVVDELKQQAEEIWQREQSKVKVFQHGPNTLNVIPEDRVALRPALDAFYSDARLPHLFEAVEHRPSVFDRRAYRAIERLKQAGPLEAEDPETNLHSDIFFTTHKAWLYLTDVTLECAPFVYVKGSHLLSRKLLSYVYKESYQQNAGSRRITQHELDDLHLEETVLTCPRGTFAMANTFGFHRRMRGTPGNERLGLHVSLRSNPFFSNR
jgi:Phytanoyl-CoA dioxygenase (PhyH)